MKAWMVRMSLSAGGKTYQLVTEQARRISGCRLTFFTDLANAELRSNGAFVQSSISLAGLGNESQPTLWQDRVRLDDGFWRSLRDHPVPVREEALRAIGTRSLAIDVYIWLAYRLHALAKPTPVTWSAIHAQFGAGFKLDKSSRLSSRHSNSRWQSTQERCLFICPRGCVLPVTRERASGTPNTVRRERPASRRSLWPLHLGRQAHQDRLDIAAGLQSEQRAAIVQQVELDVATPADQLVLAIRRSPARAHAAADDRGI